MKKIKYLLFIVFAVFFFSLDAKAETCVYKPLLNLKNEGIVGYLTWEAGSGDGIDNPYIKLISSFSGNATKIREGAENLNNTLIYKNGGMNKNKGTYTLSNFEVNYDTTNKNVSKVRATIREQQAAGTYKDRMYIDFKNPIDNIEINNSSCPTAISINFKRDEKNSEKLSNDAILKSYYLSNYGYDFTKIYKEVYNPFVQSSDMIMPVILFLETDDCVMVNSEAKNDYNCQKPKQILQALVCEIKDKSSGGNDLAEYEQVEKILDGAMTEYTDENGNKKTANIRDIYKEVEQLDSESANEVVASINKGETKLTDRHQQMIFGFIKNMRYFKQPDAQTALKEIEKDEKIISDYNNNMGSIVDCLKNAYGSDKDNAILKYSQYNPKWNGIYLDSIKKLLGLLKENVTSFYSAKVETDTVDELDFSDCYAMNNPDLQEKCKESKLKNAVDDIDCVDFVNDIDKLNKGLLSVDSFSSAELLLKDRLDKNCPNKNIDCYKNYCENAKTDTKEEAKDIIDGTTQNQANVKNVIDSYYKEILINSGIELENFDCAFFDEDILSYINGTLNLIRVIGPVLVVVLTGLDMMKLIGSFKDDESKKFFDKLKIRLICVALLILIPSIIKFLLNLLNINHCD